MFHVYWPATACLTLFLIVGVIIVLLRWGPRFCKTRHVALDVERDWQQQAYEQKVSYA
ncbi:uncharacterized protein wrm2 [Tenebrio molitor]|jgi:hypothetical protein|uniref:uncharacterized protein wrm2 n=1 Tax=Tenebrio molitor TaxID=7067 RepID=UPI0036247D6E